MHELPITKSLFKTVMLRAEKENASAVTRVVLEIGILRDFIPSIVQKYWDYISAGSIAQGSIIEIREVNATAQCSRCGATYEISRENLTSSRCPDCGCLTGRLMSGSELRILGIEIKSNNKEKSADNGTVQRSAQEN